MKSLDLKSFGVQEMNAKEITNVDGGINPWVGFLVGYVVIEAALNPKAHYKAFMDGWNGVAHK